MIIDGVDGYSSDLRVHLPAIRQAGNPSDEAFSGTLVDPPKALALAWTSWSDCVRCSGFWLAD